MYPKVRRPDPTCDEPIRPPDTGLPICPKHGHEVMDNLACPWCAGEWLFIVSIDRRSDKLTMRDDWASFSDWLDELCTNAEERAKVCCRLESDPGSVLREWRHDTGLECEKLTAAVIVCSQCGKFIAVEEWKKKDAHPSPWCISHSICVNCFAAMDQKERERWA